MKKKIQISVLVISLAMLLAIPAGNVFANDYSIYGNEIITLLEGEPTPFSNVTVAQLDNMNIYGSGFDAIFAETNRLVTQSMYAGLNNMSIYGETMDAFMRAPLFTPSFDLNFIDRLVLIK